MNRITLGLIAALFLVAQLFFSLSCQRASTNESKREASSYAERFRFVKQGDEKALEIIPIEAEAKRTRYILGDSTIITDTLVTLPQNPKRIVCLSTTHLGMLDAIGALDRVCGIGDVRWVSNPKIHQAVESKNIVEVGEENNLNLERILSLQPDYILSYNMQADPPEYAVRLQQMGIPVIMIGEFREDHPLGRAEWVRALGFLTGQQRQADSLFQNVTVRYANLTNLAKESPNTPTVLLNTPWKEHWYMPGSKSYVARLIQDANGTSPLSEEFPDAISHSLDFEYVLANGIDLDVWLPQKSMLNTLEELKKENPVYAAFKSFKHGEVYNNNARERANGANDFWEMGVAHPDLILSDIVNILHPGVNPDTTMYFYKKVK